MKKEKYERRQGMRENKKREIKGRRKELETQEKVGHTKRKKKEKNINEEENENKKK